MSDRKLRIAHLYPRLMNIYGDRGNILCLTRRCQDRGLEVEVDEFGVGDTLPSGEHDLIFMGGAQDRDQRRVADDLRTTKGPALLEAAEADTVILAVCGAYQLYGKHYVAASGTQLEGLGLFDLHTEHPGPADDRLIGNVVAELINTGTHPSTSSGWRDTARHPEPSTQGHPAPAGDHPEPTSHPEPAGHATPAGHPEPVEGSRSLILVGFENHGGRTYLGPDAQPLARLRSGYGNNGKDGTEGARYRNAFGTYLHGSLLPKNPAFADMLIALAIGEAELAPLDDEIENAAHEAALKLTGRRREPIGGVAISDSPRWSTSDQHQPVPRSPMHTDNRPALDRCLSWAGSPVRLRDSRRLGPRLRSLGSTRQLC